VALDLWAGDVRDSLGDGSRTVATAKPCIDDLPLAVTTDRAAHEEASSSVVSRSHAMRQRPPLKLKHGPNGNQSNKVPEVSITLPLASTYSILSVRPCHVYGSIPLEPFLFGRGASPHDDGTVAAPTSAVTLCSATSMPISTLLS
jgi:hypothetical protein